MFYLLALVEPKKYKLIGEFQSPDEIYKYTNTFQWEWDRYLGDRGRYPKTGLSTLRYYNSNTFDISTLNLV